MTVATGLVEGSSVEDQHTSAVGRVLEGLRGWLRRDGIVLLLFALAVVAMTYPLALKPGEGLPSQGQDIYTSFWQKWWLVKVLGGGYDPNHTPYLFYPDGLDITFQPRRWAALGAWIPLTQLFGDIAGYNLTALLGLLVSAYTAYLLVLHLTGQRGAAWLGGAFFAFYPQHIDRALGQPNTGSVQWLPLFMLVLIVVMRRLAQSWDGTQRVPFARSVLIVLPAALVLSLNAGISLKVWVLAALMGTLYALIAAFIEGWWRSMAFWRDMFVLMVLGIVLITPVTLPYFQAGWLGEAIGRFKPSTGADLYSLVLPAPGRPPFLPPFVAGLLGLPDERWGGGSFHVGVTTIALVLTGLLARDPKRSRRVIWLALAVFFWILSLGTVLRINSIERPDIWTPYRLVQGVPLFQAIRKPKRFALAFALPWAVLAGLGAAQIGRWFKKRQWLGGVVVGLLAVLMLYEINEAPVFIKPANVSPFYEHLRINAEPGAVIDLPMGRQQTKRYMFLQTVHGRPIVEGVVARMPEGAYDYIQANPLLRAWSEEQPPSCDYDIEQAIADLRADGFYYVILHTGSRELGAYFADVEMVYQAEGITVYDLDGLAAHPPCR
jgi:hypothetical protein